MSICQAISVTGRVFPRNLDGCAMVCAAERTLCTFSMKRPTIAAEKTSEVTPENTTASSLQTQETIFFFKQWASISRRALSTSGSWAKQQMAMAKTHLQWRVKAKDFGICDGEVTPFCAIVSRSEKWNNNPNSLTLFCSRCDETVPKKLIEQTRSASEKKKSMSPCFCHFDGVLEAFSRISVVSWGLGEDFRALVPTPFLCKL